LKIGTRLADQRDPTCAFDPFGYASEVSHLVIDDPDGGSLSHPSISPAKGDRL
jgi:hypothetical protein